jgi:uncharacterized protein
MPRFDRDRPAAGPLVQAFSGNGFRIDGTIYETGVKLTPADVWRWDAPSPGSLTQIDFADLVAVAPKPEFVLLGTGATLQRPELALTEWLRAEGIGLEVMDSRAAARAWGMLRGEDRWIAAALMPLDQR